MRFLIILIFALPFLSINIKAQNYSICTNVISNGGGEISGGTFSNFGVIGETFVNKSIIGGNYVNSSGFLFAYDISTDIDEINLNNKNVRIYPNPISNEFFVEIQNRNDLNINIFNSLGQKVWIKSISANQESVDMTRFNIGIYFVVVKDMNGNILLSEKIIKE